MLAWFRARARPISTVAVASLAILTVWSAAPHQEDCHDAACALLLPHDPDGHAIGGERAADDQPLHCAFCHLTRSARRPDHAVDLVGPFAPSGSRVTVISFQPLHRYASAQPPLRAPPAHL